MSKKPKGSRSGHGSDVHAIMKWALDAVFNNSVNPKFPAEYSTDPTYFGGGSPNMKLLFSFIHLLWAHLTKDNGFSYHIHRQRCLNFLLREQSLHGNNEPLTCSHGQLWAAGVSGILFVAERTNDSELMRLSASWLRVEYSLWDACRFDAHLSRSPYLWEPITPGARGVLDKVLINSNPTRRKIVLLLEAGKLLGKPNQYDLGVALLSRVSPKTRKLINPRDDSGNLILPEFPPLWGAYHVRRFANGTFYSWFDNLEGCYDPVLSAGYNGVSTWSSRTVDTDRITTSEKDLVFALDVPQGERK